MQTSQDHIALHQLKMSTLKMPENTEGLWTA
jgi:hypothetical protein